ncbi:MAG: flagellar export protein FliJ [Actinomycetales bacterium]|nr:flagellar export protein FliJ [Actinomycetales bacterium]
MSRRFRLQTLERLRSARLEHAAGALAAAGERLTAAVSLRDRLVRELRGTTAPALATPTDVQVAAHRRARLHEQTLTAEAEVRAATDAVEQARDAWVLARAQLRAVEMLHERHRAHLRHQAAHAEQRELDELAGSRVTSLRQRPAGDRRLEPVPGPTGGDAA